MALGLIHGTKANILDSSALPPFLVPGFVVPSPGKLRALSGRHPV